MDTPGHCFYLFFHDTISGVPMEKPGGRQNMEFLELPIAEVEQFLISFIREKVMAAGFSRGILGISGGLDSAVSAALSAKALGSQNVLGVMLPYRAAGRHDIHRATMLARELHIPTKIINITPMIDCYYMLFPETSPIRKGNKIARERMAVLFDLSAAEQALVLGTSNKSERLLGYGTIYGDMACGFNPLGDLYKSQVQMLAVHLKIPEEILAKKPSAGLWAGQTDEEELGFGYAVADPILALLVDYKKKPDEIETLGYERDVIHKIASLVKASRFKREMPPIAEIPEEMKRARGPSFP